MCLRGITESDWPRDRYATNIAKLPKLLKRQSCQRMAEREHRFAAPRLFGYFAAMDDVQPMTAEQAATQSASRAGPSQKRCESQ